MRSRKHVGLHALDASADLERRACVSWAAVLDEFDRFHIMSPDREGMSPGGLAEVVMARIPDHKPNIVIFNETNGRLEISSARGIDGIHGVGTQGTGSAII